MKKLKTKKHNIEKEKIQNFLTLWTITRACAQVHAHHFAKERLSDKLWNLEKKTQQQQQRKKLNVNGL